MACLSPPVRRIPRRRLPYSFGALGGSKEPYSVYHTPNKLSNPGEYAPLDKSAQPVIMKIPKAPRQAVLPLIKLQDQVNSKPSLCRVAVSACNADRYGKPKNMERDRHRHIHPPFREAKPPIAVLEPWGSKEPHSVYHIPNKMSIIAARPGGVTFSCIFRAGLI